jgi:hypothetical protein
MKSRRVAATLITTLSLFASTARAQSASVLVRANGPDGASVIACLGDRLASWRVRAEEPSVSVEWQHASACEPGSVRVLPDGGALFVDPTSAARALVRVSAEGGELFRVELSSPVWGEPLLVDRAIVLRLSDGVVQWRSISDGALLFYRRTEAAGDRRMLLSSGSPLLAQSRAGSVVCVPRAQSFECWSAMDGRSTSDFAAVNRARSTSRALALDLDRDGDDELVVATEDGAVRALSRAGESLWARTGPTRALVLGAPVAFFQGSKLLVAWADVDRWVHVVDGVSGAEMQGFPRRSDGVSRVGVRVGDVDGDGAVDVLVSERSGSLSAFRVRDASAVSVGEGPSARAPIDGETALVATGDGVVHWLAIDGAASLAHRALAATALGLDLAVLVDQRDRRPVRLAPESESASSLSVAAATVASAQPGPTGAASPRAVGCAATPALTTEPRAWIALMFALALARRRARR